MILVYGRSLIHRLIVRELESRYALVVQFWRIISKDFHLRVQLQEEFVCNYTKPRSSKRNMMRKAM